MVSKLTKRQPKTLKDLIESATLRPVTAPPSSGLVTRSRVVRVTAPTAPKSKFELEQNAFEQWLVHKLQMDEEKRKAEHDQESKKVKEQKEKGTILN